ncbi:MAG: hypothetical protein IID37_02250 [Planctomycetes bacterium]|nr:hypothetical protein [Planctomycetota bacterium]
MHFHRRRNGAALIEAVAIIGWCSMATPTLAADVPSVSSTGQSMPVQDWPVMTGRGGGAECVPDGNFELGSGAGIWTETSDTACDWVVDPTGPWGIPAPECTFAWWACGFCGPQNTNSVSQTLTIPLTATALQFTYIKWRFEPDDGDSDRVDISFDGTVMWTLSLQGATAGPEPAVTDSIDVTALQGETILLSVDGISDPAGKLTGNALFDVFVWIGGTGDACACAAECDPPCAPDESCLDGVCIPLPPICGPGNGDCCDPDANGTPGCDDEACCETICAIDPFCCDFEWDGSCSNQAQETCEICSGGGEGPPPPFDCPGDGDCCEPDGNGTPGCSNEECCTQVCDFDPFCCDTSWDQACAGAADELCEICDVPCTGDGDCDDGNDCTTDSCDLRTGECYSQEVDCDDDDPCTFDFCDDGECINLDMGICCENCGTCDGDVNCSGDVDPLDSGAIMARFGLEPCNEELCKYDVNCDGAIDPLDSGYVLARLGTCNEPQICEICDDGSCPPGGDTITCNADKEIVPNSGIACSGSETEIARCFDGSFLPADRRLVSIDVGIGTTQAGTLLRGNLYSIAACGGDFLPDADLTLLCSGSITLDGSEDQTIQTILLGENCCVPAGTSVVAEVAWEVDGELLFPAANSHGQSCPSYFSGDPCGLPDLINLELIGFPEMHLIININ